jgi:hypothetical protein
MQEMGEYESILLITLDPQIASFIMNPIQVRPNSSSLQQGACVLPQNQLKVAAQFTDPTFTDLQGWTLTKPQGAKQTYVCESTTVVGGPGVLGAGAAATRMYRLYHKL